MFSPINVFCRGDYFGKFQSRSMSLSVESKNNLNFKNIKHFKTTGNWSVKLAKFQMSQLLIPRISMVWLGPKNVPKELNTIGGYGDVK